MYGNGVTCMEKTKHFGILSCEFPAIKVRATSKAEPSEKGEVAKAVIDWLQREKPDLQITKKKAAVYCNSETTPKCYLYGYFWKDKGNSPMFNPVSEPNCMHLYAVGQTRSVCGKQIDCRACENCTIITDDICYQVYKVESHQITSAMQKGNFGMSVLQAAGQRLRSEELLEIAETWAAASAQEGQIGK